MLGLGDFAGRKLVLVFYPLDFSPVCTDQLSIYQEVVPEIEAKGGSLVGRQRRFVLVPQRVRGEARPDDPAARRLPPEGRDVARVRRLQEECGSDNRSLVLVEDGLVKWSYVTDTPKDIPGANLIFDALESG